MEEGLVQAQANPAHKRSPLYALTPQGSKVYGALDQRWREHVQALAGRYSAADLDASLRVLSSLSQVYAS